MVYEWSWRNIAELRMRSSAGAERLFPYVSEELDMSYNMEVRRDTRIVKRHMDDNDEFIKELRSIMKNMEEICILKRYMFMHYGSILQGVGSKVGKKLKEAKEKTDLKKDTSHKGTQTEEAEEILTSI